ncbi:hypothetical protein AAMO2058_000997000, partial [Amorphochlora amoebiformis]
TLGDEDLFVLLNSIRFSDQDVHPLGGLGRESEQGKNSLSKSASCPSLSALGGSGDHIEDGFQRARQRTTSEKDVRTDTPMSSIQRHRRLTESPNSVLLRTPSPGGGTSPRRLTWLPPRMVKSQVETKDPPEMSFSLLDAKLASSNLIIETSPDSREPSTPKSILKPRPSRMSSITYTNPDFQPKQDVKGEGGETKRVRFDELTTKPSGMLGSRKGWSSRTDADATAIANIRIYTCTVGKRSSHAHFYLPNINDSAALMAGLAEAASSHLNQGLSSIKSSPALLKSVPHEGSKSTSETSPITRCTGGDEKVAKLQKLETVRESARYPNR